MTTARVLKGRHCPCRWRLLVLRSAPGQHQPAFNTETHLRALPQVQAEQLRVRPRFGLFSSFPGAGTVTCTMRMMARAVLSKHHKTAHEKMHA